MQDLSAERGLRQLGLFSLARRSCEKTSVLFAVKCGKEANARQNSCFREGEILAQEKIVCHLVLDAHVWAGNEEFSRDGRREMPAMLTVEMGEGCQGSVTMNYD